jgi:hypothetical protein
MIPNPETFPGQLHEGAWRGTMIGWWHSGQRAQPGRGQGC